MEIRGWRHAHNQRCGVQVTCTFAKNGLLGLHSLVLLVPPVNVPIESIAPFSETLINTWARTDEKVA